MQGVSAGRVMSVRPEVLQNKAMLQWQEPFEILKVVSSHDYQNGDGEKGRSRHTYYLTTDVTLSHSSGNTSSGSYW